MWILGPSPHLPKADTSPKYTLFQFVAAAIDEQKESEEFSQNLTCLAFVIKSDLFLDD